VAEINRQNMAMKEDLTTKKSSSCNLHWLLYQFTHPRIKVSNFRHTIDISELITIVLALFLVSCEACCFGHGILQSEIKKRGDTSQIPWQELLSFVLCFYFRDSWQKGPLLSRKCTNCTKKLNNRGGIWLHSDMLFICFDNVSRVCINWPNYFCCM
jgi:hypothetical protein